MLKGQSVTWNFKNTITLVLCSSHSMLLTYVKNKVTSRKITLEKFNENL